METFLIFALPAIVIIVLYLFFRRYYKSPEGNPSEKPVYSIVFLRTKSKRLDEDKVRQLSAEAFGAVFEKDNPKATNFVVPMTPKAPPDFPPDSAQSFIVHYGNRWMILHNMAFPYADPAEFAKNFLESRLADTIAEHRAWLSVDVLNCGTSAEEKKAAYRDIGKLIALLADQDTLAAYLPEHCVANVFDTSMVDVLKSGSSLEIFEEPSFVPIMHIEEDDPRMIAAVAEARHRWPEFVAAFEKRQPEDIFAVKAPFRDGDEKEFMWLSVNAIEGEKIYGTLDNVPHKISTVKEDDKVTVNVGELNDWMYKHGEKLQGGFTVKVLSEAQKEKVKKRKSEQK